MQKTGIAGKEKGTDRWKRRKLKWSYSTGPEPRWDYGSSAPAEVFAEIFEEAGIHLTREEITARWEWKKGHIPGAPVLEEAGRQWEACWQRPWNEEDVEALYERFEEKLAEVVARYSVPIEDVVLTVGRLREMGLKIGSTTGYNAQMMETVIPVAEAGGISSRLHRDAGRDRTGKAIALHGF